MHGDGQGGIKKTRLLTSFTCVSAKGVMTVIYYAALEPANDRYPYKP
ncbi:hypothetical protein MP213Fo_00970 [Pseudochrobactrum sp. MP213Fo]